LRSSPTYSFPSRADGEGWARPIFDCGKRGRTGRCATGGVEDTDGEERRYGEEARFGDARWNGKERRQETRMIKAARAGIIAFLVAGLTSGQEPVSFATRDGWIIHGDLYGSGGRGIVLVHGGRFEKGCWQMQAQVMVKAGFRALAIDLRGFGLSKEGSKSMRSDFGSPLDVPAADTCMRRAQGQCRLSERAWEATQRREHGRGRAR
jgi:hypothetical protein